MGKLLVWICAGIFGVAVYLAWPHGSQRIASADSSAQQGSKFSISSQPEPIAKSYCCSPQPEDYVRGFPWLGQLAFQMNVSGASSAGSVPYSTSNRSAELEINNLDGIYEAYVNRSGHNNVVSSSPEFERTGIDMIRTDANQSGYGDLTNNRCFGQIQTAGLPMPQSSSEFNQSTALHCIISSQFATQPGGFLNGAEFNMNDMGRETQMVGIDINIRRGAPPDVPTGPTAEGISVQNNASKYPADSAYSTWGQFNIGLDLAGMKTGTSAITIPANTKICMSATHAGPGESSLTTRCGNAYVYYDGRSVRWNEGLSVPRIQLHDRGYAGQVMPNAAPAPDPEIITFSCLVNGPSTACTFPNGFAFADTKYTCQITFEGAVPRSESYVKTGPNEITIYQSPSSAATADTSCTGRE